MKRLVGVAVVFLALASALATAGPSFGQTAEPAGAAPSEELLAFVESQFGLTGEAAQLRLDAEAAAGDLQPVLAATWPSTFAGLWLNNSGPDTTVTVAFTSDVDQRLDDVRGLFPYPELVEGIVHQRSLQALDALLAVVVTERTAIQQGVAPVAISDRILATEGLYDVAVDVRRNRVLVLAGEADASTSSAFVSRYGPVIEVIAGRGEPYACTREDCRYDMRGGVHLRVGTQDMCTSAFPVQGNSGRRFTLSAGHCGLNANAVGVSYDPGARRDNGGVQYGTVDGDAVRNSADAERVVAVSPWGHNRGVFIDSSTTNPINSYKPYALLVPGTIIQGSLRSGSNPYATVWNTNVSPHWVPNSSRFLTTWECFGQSGDSGAPFWSFDQGVGIFSGSFYVQTLAGCVIFGALEFALQELNVFLIS